MRGVKQIDFKYKNTNCIAYRQNGAHKKGNINTTTKKEKIANKINRKISDKESQAIAELNAERMLDVFLRI